MSSYLFEIPFVYQLSRAITRDRPLYRIDEDGLKDIDIRFEIGRDPLSGESLVSYDHLLRADEDE